MRQGFLLTVIVSIVFCASVLGFGGDMGTGTNPNTNGSEAYPWLIEDLDDFDTFADPANAATYWAADVHTKLMTNIDLAGRTYTTAVIASETDWRLGGFQGTPYSGSFDGNNKVISNVKINFPNGHYIGVFGYVDSNGQIKNLSAGNIDIEVTGYYVGGLIGYNEGNVSVCSTTGHIVGRGGLVGFSQGVISNSFASVSVTGSGGGLVGWNQGTINDCYATGDVIGNFVGGLVGENGGVIQNCYSTGSVTALEAIGAIANAGGLVGSTGGTGLISHCYASGSISGTGFVGGIMGIEHNYANYENCFWDITKNPSLQDSGSRGEVADIFAESTTNLKTQNIFTDWDFTTPVWVMLRPGEDYPRLAWQAVFEGDIAGLYGVDMVDFAYLAHYWGQDCGNPECDRADIDTSGTIDLPDLAAVAADWLR